MRPFRSVGFQKTGQRVYRSARPVANHKCRSRSGSVPILVCGYAFALSMIQLGRHSWMFQFAQLRGT